MSVDSRRASLLLSSSVLSLVLSSCKPQHDPIGPHRGVCTASYKALSGSTGTVPSSESCGDSFTVFKEGDAYKVDLGDCTIHLRAPDHEDDAEWKIAGPAPCATKHGPARIADGKLYWVGGAYNLAFEGSTDDKKLSVGWGFTSDAKSR